MTKGESSIAKRLIALLDNARDLLRAGTITMDELKLRHEAAWLLIGQTSMAVRDAINANMKHRINVLLAAEVPR